MTNIRDIAKRTGYSVSTVSRVLNHQNYVSDGVRANIQAVIDELDYVPNAVAKNLSRGRTKTIGVVLPHTDHPYFTQLVHGIMNAAFAANYQIILLPSRYEADLERQYLLRLREKAYDALIFTSHGIPLSELADYQKWGKVVICENPHTSGLLAAYAHRQACYQQVFADFKQRQFINVGILLSRPIRKSATSQATIAAYKHIFKQAPAVNNVVTGVTSYQDGWRAGQQLMQTAPHLNAILANGDDIALGVQEAYQRAGEQVPYLIGQENQKSGIALKIPTIDHHFEQVGQAAFELAIQARKESLAINSKLLFERTKFE